MEDQKNHISFTDENNVIALSKIIPLTWACSSYNSDIAAPELEVLSEFRNTTLMLKDIMEPSDAGQLLWNRYCQAKDPKMITSQVQL